MSPRVIFNAAQAWLDRQYPGWVVDGVCLRLQNGKEIPLPAPPPKPRRLDVPTAVRGIHARILAAAAPEPVKGRILARRAGLGYNSTSRQALADLVRDKKLIRNQDGYHLP
jgi:hypothetical protein